ncbi:helix-turn-helix transcriptional regulator [Paenibacillus aurantius]|uniref:Helix-turn-helix transcriptional regulator n=1 Tax=Paenibacillus aurantius TaxID=2918900 RepID=A0AA96LEZ0_9BACL|nr:helix-turn-helix transcriptional regulator [Paenibacillus aurantius]WNQ12075.1 helix-turn-helix transcriptional regulator [Paenibacillus aurantius]
MHLEAIFGKILKSLRIKQELTQDKLAEISTLERTFISMMERGKSQPSLTTIFELAKALKIKPSELVRLIELEFENQTTTRYKKKP